MKMRRKVSIRPPIKIYGGKYRIKNWILSFFPENYTQLNYIEPFIGGGNVYLNKLDSNVEVISDIDYEVYSVWHVLKYRYTELKDFLNNVTFGQAVFHYYRDHFRPNDIVEVAAKRIIVSRMSKNGMGKDFSDCMRRRGGKPGDENAWDTFLAKEIDKIHKRLLGTDIFNRDAFDIINDYSEAPNTFFYLDPPYLLYTRTTKFYEFEMSKYQHVKLLDLICSLDAKCKFMISSYDNELYNKKLKNWNKQRKETAINISMQKNKSTRFECIWFNY